ncbi:hypothetical protein H9L39_11284 [Fusarium oxysporum f. sp. albedinis]|nr:hypothetical protein H9L39_11284 [Fusarium oxysporum f. sp. albedinis]
MTDFYKSVHKNPKGPGDARPTAVQIIQDEKLEGKLSSHVVFITGCSSGIGVETAKALYLTGAQLYLTARNLAKAKKALGHLIDDPRVHLSLNVLICSAGVMTPPEGRTQDGFEIQFGTNHLAHFLLFSLLRPALLAGTTSERASRVVIVASVAHRFGAVHFDNINFEGCYDAMAAYAQSKTANIWMANEIERRYGEQGIHAWSLQPGSVLTDLTRHFSDDQRDGIMSDPYLKSINKFPDQGAATSVWAATAAALEGEGGRYLEDCQIIGPWNPSLPLWGPGYGTHAYDVERAQMLWEKSRQWVGL